MEIIGRLDEGIAVLALVGRLTINDPPGLLKSAASRAVADGARVVALDLSQVPYIDSTRLGDLIGAHITVSRQNGRLILICPTKRMSALLRLAGLEGIFETYASLDDARRALSSPG